MRLGSGADKSPKMAVPQPMGGTLWPNKLKDGALFAGDDAFGGVMLRPETGELAWMQLEDWPAFQQERAQVDPERRARAEQAELARRLH